MENNDNKNHDYNVWLTRQLRMNDVALASRANGWSLWARAVTLPLLVLALWSHQWIGIGGAAILTALVAIWGWAHPRLLPARGRTDTFYARAVFGERVWLNRFRVPIPREREIRALVMWGLIASGAVIGVWGAVSAVALAAIGGVVLALGARLAFHREMALLYRDMKREDPIYRSWERVAANDNARHGGRPRRPARRTLL